DFGTLVKNGNSGYTYTAKDRTVTSFDAGGRETRVTDPDGLARVFAYDGSGRVSTITSPDGGVTTFTYAGARLRGITARGNRGTAFSYGANGDLRGITDAAGNQRSLAYDGSHRLVNDQYGPNNVTYTYDIAGRLSRVDRGLGTTLTIRAQQEQGLVQTAQ